jgi:hypothetical protein
MVYYGVLGVKVSNESSRIIFDVGYDMKLMKVLIAKAKDGITYILNPAFHAALSL